MPKDQATLDKLAAGRAKRTADIAAKKAAAASATTDTPKKDDKPSTPADKPAPKPERCHKCWARPCECTPKAPKAK